MKKLILLTCLCLLIISCNKEESNLEVSNEDLITETYYYMGNTYEIQSKLNSNGDLEEIEEIPKTLVDAFTKPNLATVLDGDVIYLFDDEESKFEHYNMDYVKLVKSRNDNPSIKTDVESSKTQSNIYSGVNCYLDILFGGGRMNFTSLNDLKNLTTINWNDKISSLYVSPPYYRLNNYQYPNGNYVIFYEHANFGGRSLEFFAADGFHTIDGLGVGFRRLKDIRSGGKNWADRISSIDVVVNGFSQIR